tara:strand:- start:21 stop:434 length:414 start_codon:yes stop_codon:yes gene_type:complete
MTTVKTLKVESSTSTMKAKDLLTISQGLAYLNSKETRVWHTLTKNLDSISSTVNTINDGHRKLVDELATKDEHGNAVRNDQNQIEFGDNMTVANDSWTKTLEEDVEVTLYPINLEDIKEYGLDANVMKPLLGVLVME